MTTPDTTSHPATSHDTTSRETAAREMAAHETASYETSSDETTSDETAPHETASHESIQSVPTGTLAGRPVARVGYGALQLAHATDRDAAIALVRRAVDAGVDHIDTAHFYRDGVVNDVLRRALRSDDGVVLVSKVGARWDESSTPPLVPAQRPAELRAEVHANLASLGVERIDVVNLRRLDGPPGIIAEGDQIVPIDDQLAELIALRDAGLIGAIGLSGVAPDTVRAAAPAGIVCVQNAYSVLSREHEDGLRLCEQEGIAWVPFFPLGGGSDRYPDVTEDADVRAVATDLGVTPAQVALAWLLHHSDQMLLIPGTTSPVHLDENLASARLELDGRSMARLDAVVPGDR